MTTNTPVGGGNGFPLRESQNFLNQNRYSGGMMMTSNGHHQQFNQKTTTNPDAFTYLRFGLPRVKTIQQSKNNNQQRISNDDVDDEYSMNNRMKKISSNHKINHNQNNQNSAAINEELKKRFWSSSETALINPNTTTTTTSSSPSSTSSSTENISSDSSKNHHHLKNNNPIITNTSTNYMKRSSDISHHHHHHVDSHYSHHNNNSDIDDYHPSSRHSPPLNLDDEMINNEQQQRHQQLNNQLPPPLAKYPHLFVKNLMYEVDKSSNWRRLCGFSRQKLRILEDISFDVRGGELMAIMATSATEGSALLNVLGAKHDYRNGVARLELYLNGISITVKQLNKILAYVTNDIELCSTMSTRQLLLFAGLLLGPASRSSMDVKRLTRQLLEELNLGDVRHTKLSELTYSERKRLHIAMHLLLDTELLLIDQPLLGLDIFDSFFLIEYLRQWATIGGRIVIMTVQPPTYEIFTMINRIVLISSGRSLYVGHRKDFVRYFSSIGYPCPSFKNPSDYYLDLVTIDDLSQEALLESSQRIETIADLHSRRSMTEIFSSMPGPPAVLPAPFKRANFAMQFLALWIRALIFSFPYNVVHLFNRFIITFLLSLIIGAIYWQIRTGREQEFVWDRIGFINTMISIGIVPILTLELINAYKEKLYIISEVHQGLYSLLAYLLAKLLYSTPQTILIGIAYALPACSMAGLQLHTNPNSLPFYLLLMLTYFLAIRSFIYAIVWCCNRRSMAIFIFGLIFTIMLLSSGLNIQYRDISITHRWLRQISPIRWLHEAIVAWEFEPNILIDNNGNNGNGIVTSSSFLCSRNPVIQQPNAILVRADCGFQTRSNILKWFEYQGGNIFQSNIRPSWHAFLALFILYITSFIIGTIIFCLRVYYFNTTTSATNVKVKSNSINNKSTRHQT